MAETTNDTIVANGATAKTCVSITSDPVIDNLPKLTYPNWTDNRDATSSTAAFGYSHYYPGWGIRTWSLRALHPLTFKLKPRATGRSKTFDTYVEEELYACDKMIILSR